MRPALVLLAVLPIAFIATAQTQPPMQELLGSQTAVGQPGAVLLGHLYNR